MGMATVKLTTTNFYQNLLSISEFYVLNKETKGVTIEINLILRPHIGFVVRRRNLMLLHLRIECVLYSSTRCVSEIIVSSALFLLGISLFWFFSTGHYII